MWEARQGRELLLTNCLLVVDTLGYTVPLYLVAK